MTTMHWTEALVKLKACEEAVKWAKGYPSLQAAWDVCERGDWILWLAGRVAGPPDSDSRRKLVDAAVRCARLALPYAGKAKEICDRTRCVVEAYLRGEASLADTRAAADAAAAAYADDARSRVLRECAEIVRGSYPAAPSIVQE